MLLALAICLRRFRLQVAPEIKEYFFRAVSQHLLYLGRVLQLARLVVLLVRPVFHEIEHVGNTGLKLHLVLGLRLIAILPIRILPLLSTLFSPQALSLLVGGSLFFVAAGCNLHQLVERGGQLLLLLQRQVLCGLDGALVEKLIFILVQLKLVLVLHLDLRQRLWSQMLDELLRGQLQPLLNLGVDFELLVEEAV